MKRRFLADLLSGFKYLVLQSTVEIILIVVLEYSGIGVLDYFSKANLFIENVQGVSWEIGMKALIFVIPYLCLFLLFAMLRRKPKSSTFHCILNGVISVGLSAVFLLGLRHLDFNRVKNLMVTTFIASVLIFFTKMLRRSGKSQVVLKSFPNTEQ